MFVICVAAIIYLLYNLYDCTFKPVQLNQQQPVCLYAFSSLWCMCWKHALPLTQKADLNIMRVNLKTRLPKLINAEALVLSSENI